jgi:hypothetical protein
MPRAQFFRIIVPVESVLTDFSSRLVIAVQQPALIRCQDRPQPRSNLKREKMIAEIKSLKFFFADYLLQNCSDKQLEEILEMSRDLEKLRKTKYPKESQSATHRADGQLKRK